MKTSFCLIIPILLIFHLSSCSVHKKATNTTKNVPQNTTVALSESNQKTPTYSDSLGMLVSFYSIGEGIDLSTNKKFVNFLDSYSGKITYEATRVGREGEINYCIKINKLPSTEQDTFIKKTKEILQKSTLVHINENTPCVKKD